MLVDQLDIAITRAKTRHGSPITSRSLKALNSCKEISLACQCPEKKHLVGPEVVNEVGGVRVGDLWAGGMVCG